MEELRSNPDKMLLLDGGTGEELLRNHVPDDRNIWSATALVHPQYHAILRDVHQSYLSSGSTCITTNSYGVVPGVGFAKDEIVRYMDLSGQIARRAVETFAANHNNDKPCFVLGSLGPLVESYRADLILPHDEGVDCYTTACGALGPHVDAFLGETLSCVEESLQIVHALEGMSADEKHLRRPLFLSYTLDSSGKPRDGQDVTEGIRRLLAEVEKKENVERKSLIGINYSCN
jgi:S-methylmethionine-dependent homocysteine/selenocysteine methylase